MEMIQAMIEVVQDTGAPVNHEPFEDIMDESQDSTLPNLPDHAIKLLGFIVTLIKQPLSSLRSEFESPLLCSIAAMSLQRDSSFASPGLTTPVLSGIIKIIRLLSLTAIWVKLHQQRLPETWFDSTLEDFVEKFLTVNHQSPMTWLLQTRAYGLRISFTTTPGGEFFWENDTQLSKPFVFHGSVSQYGFRHYPSSTNYTAT